MLVEGSHRRRDEAYCVEYNDCGPNQTHPTMGKERGKAETGNETTNETNRAEETNGNDETIISHNQRKG
jgi:hypothetical protein